MDQRIKKLWVKDLLNPDYTHGKFKLRYRDSYCPLGRLCELHRREHPRDEWESYVAGGGSGYTYLGQQTELPLSVAIWARLDQHVVSVPNFPNFGYDVFLGDTWTGRGNKLTQLNDVGDIPLDKIAHLINQYL